MEMLKKLVFALLLAGVAVSGANAMKRKSARLQGKDADSRYAVGVAATRSGQREQVRNERARAKRCCFGACVVRAFNACKNGAIAGVKGSGSFAKNVVFAGAKKGGSFVKSVAVAAKNKAVNLCKDHPIKAFAAATVVATPVVSHLVHPVVSLILLASNLVIPVKNRITGSYRVVKDRTRGL